ncbi:nuclear transport factor 2 family protein [Psychrobium sp. 1_MG-2023]|uniref:nuclear transport factor 2 family protein n=1 Tax=Psychrobium sp. 1_MG-2023 TaxID=3062624 RepID=UPI000C34AC1C|nr:nuclear transport factor 2 family protein [Psychrobium sp. 1_MG-2023]MDP2561608.1 nuclear transport factor 2 family protein [Psychrobium sp. 1_MG-2023]PKF55627.1 hypothetical protein CW748_12265 [Alteromonadales bacterium alter-6D02]
MNFIKQTATTIIVLVAISMTVRAESITSLEHQAVIDTAYNYFNGAANGDQKQLQQAFDTAFGDVKMIRIDKDSGQEIIRTVPLKEFAGFFKKATKDTWQAKILSVDIVDNKMAMVKLDFETPKTHYVDYLVMYKRNDAWRIVNKTFVATKK